MLLSLGEEEEEFLFPVGGFYHKEKQLIFVCMWEEYDQVLKTLLHEFRHAMQKIREIYCMWEMNGTKSGGLKKMRGSSRRGN